VTIVKLGGSFVSDKTVDFSFREKHVLELAKAMAASQERVVLVHGGGAFGHPMAKKYGLSSSKSRRSSEGVAETRGAMFDLNMRVCDVLSLAGLRPYTFSPYPLLGLSGERGSSWLRSLIDSGLTPVTFGDVIYERGFRIISGDTISLELSKSLGAVRCIFVMDVDGVLDRRGRPISVLDKRTSKEMRMEGSSDATGGIGLKVVEAMKIAKLGTEVAFVSGFRSTEFAKALKRQRFHGTIVKVPPRDQQDIGRKARVR